MHKDISERPSVITKNVSSRSKNVCVFFLLPRGCKKGINCTHSHEAGGQLPIITKVPKLCDNGPRCTWKPRCRYVHMEDGESIPARANGAHRQMERRPQIKHCHWSASECPRGGPTSCSYAHRPEQSNQDFATGNYSQPPPGNSLKEFPDLPAPRRQSIFRINPQHQ